MRKLPSYEEAYLRYCYDCNKPCGCVLFMLQKRTTRRLECKTCSFKKAEKCPLKAGYIKSIRSICVDCDEKFKIGD